MYIVRFDLRAPQATPEQRAARHRTAIDMATWVDQRGGGTIVISEHHGSADGYLPSPLVLASAIAGATKRVRIIIAAAVLPFYDPVRLAEDMVTLDHISHGRVWFVLGLGYRPEEYEMYGVDYAARGQVADEKLQRLLLLLDNAGNPEVQNCITPAPLSTPRSMIFWGGRSRAAARRAGRFGLGFYGQTNDPELQVAYEAAAREHGHPSGMCFLPSPDAPMIVFVEDAGDIDRGWSEVGEAMLVDARGYRSWHDAAGTTEGTASLSTGDSTVSLRALNGSHRVVSPAQARALVAQHGFLGLHPLCGGLDTETAWRYLRSAVDAVRPEQPTTTA